jgi:DNA-damage-inducible protein J
MAKTGFIRARIEPELKTQAEEIFSKLGLSPTDAITLFYVQVTLHGGLPFEVRIPNNETIEAMRQAGTGEGLNEHADLQALKSGIG